MPCGHCLECLSHRRNEWSVRLQLHCDAYDSMPFFVTLTYNDDHLPLSTGRRMTLYPKHVVDFIKRLRARYNLYDTDFTYFGCGEYGDTFGRPHYHMILYGFTALEKLFNTSAIVAEQALETVWQHGHVDVCVANYGGIHYTTKYVLKSMDQDFPDIEKPFVMASKGIGKSWLNSAECKRIRSKFNKENFNKVVDGLPVVDWSSPVDVLRSCNDILAALRPYVMDFRVTLPTGDIVPMPRYFKKKIFGSFEDWRCNPLAYYNYIKSLRNRYKYLVQYGEYDETHSETMESQKQKSREQTIRKRIINKIK